jgi:hypothetical protein
MTKAIGGKGNRKYIPPVIDDGSRCGYCGARRPYAPLDHPHICKELTYGTAVTPVKIFPIEDL